MIDGAETEAGSLHPSDDYQAVGLNPERAQGDGGLPAPAWGDGSLMAIEIVNTEGVSAPKNGTVFNVRYGDSVTKVRWNDAKQDWQAALSDGRWVSLTWVRDRSRPLTWWPAKSHQSVRQLHAALEAIIEDHISAISEVSIEEEFKALMAPINRYLSHP
jgi:hypothetical protein